MRNIKNYPFALVGLLLASLFGCNGQITSDVQAPKSDSHQTVDNSDSGASNQQTIDLTVELKFNGRRDDLSWEINCDSPTSVFQATLQACQKNDIEFDHTGSEPQWKFVRAIGGVTNEKSAGDNWTYRINEKLGSVGCGMAKLEPGDVVVWSFGKYEVGK